MKQKIALIGAIEGTENRVLEKDYLFFIKTLRKNAGKYSNIDIYLLQPTKHDILDSTLKQLSDLNVNFIKKISDYNQPGREFNYTNKPIACDFFYETIKDYYDYFLWIDGDVAVLKEFELPESLNDSDIVFLHNNEFYDSNSKKYISYNSQNFINDEECYSDLLSKINVENKNYTATNSWFIYAPSKSVFWKEWNSLTRDYIFSISEFGKEKFKFAENTLNFENRVEELTMDIVIRQNCMNKISPSNVHTFNTPDLANSHDFIEKYNSNSTCVHFDDIKYLSQNEHLKKYFENSYLKSQLISVYGMDTYKQIF